MSKTGSMTAQTVRRAQRNAAIYMASRQIPTAFCIVALVDILLPLPMFLRGLLVIGLPLTFALSARRQARLAPTNEAFVARALETRQPELDNALIHAVQFSEILTAAPAHPAAALMNREMERARSEIARIKPADVVAITPLKSERLRLFAVAAAIFCLGLLFPRAVRFEMPRLFLFWQDNPPFTLTDFHITPPGATLRSGDSLTVMLKVSGLLPRHLELVSRTAGEAPQTVPMLAEDTNFYTARLTGLTRDTYFYAGGDTGRSKRFWIHITNPIPPPKKPAAPQESPASAPKPDPAQKAKNDLHKLADAQAKLARDMAQQAKQAAKQGAKTARQKANAAQQKANSDALRQRQQELQKQAAELARQLREQGQPSKDLENAARQMQKARDAATPNTRSQAAQQAAQQLQKAEQEKRLAEQGKGKSDSAAGVVAAKPDGEGYASEPDNPKDRGPGETGQSANLGPPLTAKDRAASRYPVEYRNLVRNYFKSVAGK